MIDKKKFLEGVVGGIIFGSIYFLCKFQVALEIDGTIVDPSSTMGQAFCFAKIFLGILAAKFVGQELVTLVEKTWPMVQVSVNAQVESERAMDRAKKGEKGKTVKESGTQEAKKDQEAETSLRQD